MAKVSTKGREFFDNVSSYIACTMRGGNADRAAAAGKQAQPQQNSLQPNNINMKNLAQATSLAFFVSLLGPRAAEAQALKWKYATGSEVRSSPALGPDGTVYFGSYDSNIYAISVTPRRVA